MHEYDTALKEVLIFLAQQALREITGFDVPQWRDVELPEVSNPRMDLLGEITEGRLVHIELQSTNDDQMALRMADYALRVYRQKRIFPRQFVLYVGESPLRMSDRIDLPQLRYEYRLIDVRDLDGERLLQSDSIGDNIISILTRVRDRRGAIRRVLDKIARLEQSRRARMFRLLMVLAGLRKMGTEIEEEAKHMPILNDINDHEVLGREYKRGLQYGVQQGIQQGMQQGELKIFFNLVESRFGAISAEDRKRISALSPSDLERLSLNLLNAPTLSDLLRSV